MSIFAIQVRSGREDAYVELFSKTRPEQSIPNIPSIHNIKKKMQTRRKGKAISLMSCLFPGYLFFQTSEAAPSPALIVSMRQTKYFMRFLPATENIQPLGEKDAQIIRKFISFGKEIGPSLVVFDENKRIRVIEGPIMGLEGRIVKVDRRKRIAKICLDINDSPLFFNLSFDVLETVKKPDAP